MSPLTLSTVFLLLIASSQQQQQGPISPIKMAATRFGVKYDEALEAIFAIAVRLESLLSDMGAKTSKNFMVSPLSMAVAVGELMLGAKGSFQRQLYDLLTIDGTNVTRSDSVRHLNDGQLNFHALHQQLGDLMQNLQSPGTGKSFKIKTASALFTLPDLVIKPEYAENVRKFYGTEVRPVEFRNDPIGSEKIVNQWVSDNTEGLIKHIVPGALPGNTAAIFANAVYFRALWEVPFSSMINRRDVFYTSPNSSVNVTYMNGKFENYKYVNSARLKCRMVVIPYMNNELAMYIILPNEDGGKEYDINKFTSRLKTKDVIELINEAKEHDVYIFLPKMALSNTVKVLGPLKRYYRYKNQVDIQTRLNNEQGRSQGDNYDKLDEKVDFFRNLSGVEDRFGGGLDLSGISDDPRFTLSEIYQQMTLSVNEKGTEAAAVSASAVDYMLDFVSFRIERPFLFFIRHEATEASLFWGTIVDPTEQE